MGVKEQMDKHDRHLLAKWEADGSGPDLTPSKHTLSEQERRLKMRMEKDLEKFTNGVSK